MFRAKLNKVDMESESFSLVLASNASTHIHSDNTLSHFTNILPKPLDLPRNTQVALENITFDNAFTNIPSNIARLASHILIINTAIIDTYTPTIQTLDSSPTNVTYTSTETSQTVSPVKVTYTLPQSTVTYLSLSKDIQSQVGGKLTLYQCHVGHTVKPESLLFKSLEKYSFAIEKNTAEWLGLIPDPSDKNYYYNDEEYIVLLERKIRQMKHGALFKSSIPKYISVVLSEITPTIQPSGYKKELAAIPYNRSPKIFHFEPDRKEYHTLSQKPLTSLEVKIQNEKGEALNLQLGQASFIKLHFSQAKAMEKTFIIKAKSTDSKAIFPSNTAHNFKVKLPHNVYINEKSTCHVALSSMYYPTKFNYRYVLNRDKYFMILKTEAKTCNIYFDTVDIYKFNDIRNTISNQVHECGLRKNIMIQMDDPEKLKIQVTGKVTVIFSRLFLMIMGEHLRTSDVKETKEYNFETAIPSVISSTINFKQLFPHTILVYSNIVKPSIVGDQYAPLLRIVPNENENNDVIRHYHVQHLDFIPLHVTQFSEINFQLRDSSGNFFGFENDGEVGISLLFKQKINEYNFYT